MKEGWYVVAPNGEQELGPFTGAQLVQLAQQKRINSKTLLLHPTITSSKRVTADTVKQLKLIFDAPPKAELITTPQTHPEDAIIEGGMKLVGGALRGISSTVGTVRAMIPSRETHSTVAEPELPAVPIEIGNFVADGQDTKMVVKLLDRVKGICTSNEQPVYMAVQQRPIANFSPDAVVLTNERFIIFVQKVLGRLNFYDYMWRDVHDVHLKEDLIGSTISFTSVAGSRIAVDWLPKSQARKVYRIAQEQEQAAFRMRRELMLEEKKAGAAQTIVNTNVQTGGPAGPSSDDPVVKLSQLKKMLDAGLIEQSEYDAKKAQLLDAM